MAETFTPKIYLLITCPFCLKLRIFLSEAGLSDTVSLVVFEQDDQTHQSIRRRMKDAGQTPSFPAAELEEGKITTGSDDLISHFAGKAGVDPSAMPLLGYYTGGVFQRFQAMHEELDELKSDDN